jgi:hypothetical protein
MATFDTPHSGNSNVVTRVEISDGSTGEINYSISLVRLSSSVQSFNTFGSPSGANIANVNIFGYDLGQTFYNYDWWYRYDDPVKRTSGSTVLTGLESKYFRVGMTLVSGVGLRSGSTITQIVGSSAVSMSLSATSSGTSNAVFSRTQPAASVLIKSGTLTVTPGSTGNITLTNSAGSTVGSATINQSFTAAPPPGPTWQTSSTLPVATRNTPYSRNVTASPVTSYTFVSSSENTRGLSFSGNTISGTPTSVGVVTFTIRASHNGINSDRTFSVTINPALPVFSDASVNNASLNIAYSDNVSASEAASYSVRNSANTGAGTLPDGLTLTTTGVEAGKISGTPTTIGITSFRIRATNVTGSTDTEILTIEVRNNLGKRQTSSGFQNIETSRRFDGTTWIQTTVSKRFDGTSWVDVSNS